MTIPIKENVSEEKFFFEEKSKIRSSVRSPHPPSVPQSSTEQSSNWRSPAAPLVDKSGTQVRLSQGDGEVLPERNKSDADGVDGLGGGVCSYGGCGCGGCGCGDSDGLAATAVVADVPVRAAAGSFQGTRAAKGDNTTCWWKKKEQKVKLDSLN